MVVQTRPISVEEFDDFVDLPQNADRLFEYIGGQVSGMCQHAPGERPTDIDLLPLSQVVFNPAPSHQLSQAFGISELR